MARTAPENESMFTTSRSRNSGMRRDRANGLIGGPVDSGIDSRLNYHHNNHRQTSPDELYEIASVFKPVPGYERPWEMAPPRYWGQLRRLFLEESIKSSSRKEKEAALNGTIDLVGGSGGNSSLLTNSSSSASTNTNELDSTSGASSSSGSLGSFSLSRGSSSAHANSSINGGGVGGLMTSDGPMSPLWEAGHPPKHWPCLYNIKRHDDQNHHYNNHNHNQSSKLHNNDVIPTSKITFDQPSFGRDRPN